MNNAVTLFKRHTKLYFRDRAAVFFSFLSSLILVALYIMFLGKLQIDGIKEYGVPLEDRQISFLMYNIVFASVTIMNSLSIPLCALTIMTRDFENGKQNGFLLTKAKPRQLLLSYFLTATLITILLNIAVWLAGSLIIGVLTGLFLSFDTVLSGLGACVLISLIGAAIMTLVVTLVKSTAAVNVLGGVSATFFGFICGIYIPYSTLGNGMKIFGSLFPFSHLVVWCKRILINDAFAKFDISAEFQSALRDNWFSANSIGFCGIDLPLWVMLIFSGIFAAGCLILAAFLLRKRLGFYCGKNLLKNR